MPGLEEGSDHYQRTNNLLEAVAEAVQPQVIFLEAVAKAVQPQVNF